jgi:acyl-coenzyme A synthetase/AMP-(fatty) acid ligase
LKIFDHQPLNLYHNYAEAAQKFTTTAIVFDSVNSTLAIEDYLLDQLDFLKEVILIRGVDNQPQPVLAVRPGEEMDWDAWWEKISDLPHMHYPIMRTFDEIPHTATMKVQRLQLEKELKEHQK